MAANERSGTVFVTTFARRHAEDRLGLTGEKLEDRAQWIWRKARRLCDLRERSLAVLKPYSFRFPTATCMIDVDYSSLWWFIMEAGTPRLLSVDYVNRSMRKHIRSVETAPRAKAKSVPASVAGGEGSP